MHAARAMRRRGPGATCAGQGRGLGTEDGRPGSVGLDCQQFTQVRASAPRLGLCGPALPSPTSGGPARFIRPARRRRKLARARAASATLDSPRPSTGCANARRAACRNWRSSPSAPGAPVLRVAGHGVADRLQVGADLVRAAGLQPHAQQRGVRERPLDLEVRDRLARLVGVGRDPRAHAAVAAERGVDRARARRRAALDEREVLARDPRAPRASPCSAAWTGSRARDDEQARRVAVEPVDDARRGPGRRRRRRGPRAPARACRRGARAPGARRRRPACRPPAGARPRRRRRTSPAGRGLAARDGAGADRRSARRPASAWRLGRARAVDRARSPASISRCAAAREPGVRGQEHVEALARRLGRDDELAVTGAHAAAVPRARRAASSTPSVIAMSATLKAGQAGA